MQKEINELLRRFQSLFFWKSYWKPTPHFRAQSEALVSILVLLEKLLEEGFSSDREPFFHVSILVLLEKLLEGLFWKKCWKRRKSFNPCSSGKATGSSTKQRQRISSTGVSILVLLEKLLEESPVRLTWPKTSVSILVLLEKLLEGGDMSEAELRGICFNPCSSGKATGSVSCHGKFLPLVLFQSLFFWKSYWKSPAKE